VNADFRERETPAAAPVPAVDLAAIYRANVGYVWRTLQRLGVRERDLEDVTHDVFVVVYRRLHTYDRSLPLRPWLFGIAFRVAAADRRLARHDAEVVTERIDVADLGEPVDERAASASLVLAALDALAAEQRAVLVMHDLDGYTAPEIAAALETPLNTVYSRLRLARAKFSMTARRLVEAGQGS
jgi:RNA polymerase sigma-70 factor (ECF subfamily)